MSYKCSICGGRAKYNAEDNTFLCVIDGILTEDRMFPLSLDDLVIYSLAQLRTLGIAPTRQELVSYIKLTLHDMKSEGFYVKEIPNDVEFIVALERLEKHGYIRQDK